MPILEVQDLHVSFGNLNVLNGVNLSVERGERLAILGPGGCGKSSLLKAIIGLVPPRSGNIRVMNTSLTEAPRSERDTVLRKVGMAFQQGALFDFMTVRENILFAVENMTKMSDEESESLVLKFLEEVKLPHAIEKIPSELSGGMRRRVGIVRALITKPELALLDEPTAGLDPVTTTVVIDMIHRLGDETGATLVCVTSSVEVAFTFAKKVALLREGQIVATGTWDELHSSGDDWIRNFLDIRDFHPDRTQEL